MTAALMSATALVAATSKSSSSGSPILLIFLVIGAGFQDSEGRHPRNSDFAGHVRVYGLALSPVLFPVAAGWVGWRLRR